MQLAQICKVVAGGEVRLCLGGKAAYPTAKLMESGSGRPLDQRASPRETVYCQATDHTPNPVISETMPVNTEGDTGDSSGGTNHQEPRYLGHHFGSLSVLFQASAAPPYDGVPPALKKIIPVT